MLQIHESQLSLAFGGSGSTSAYMLLYRRGEGTAAPSPHAAPTAADEDLGATASHELAPTGRGLDDASTDSLVNDAVHPCESARDLDEAVRATNRESARTAPAPPTASVPN